MNNKYEFLFKFLILFNGVEVRNCFVLVFFIYILLNDDGIILDIELFYIEKCFKDVGIVINVVSNVNDVGKVFFG